MPRPSDRAPRAPLATVVHGLLWLLSSAPHAPSARRGRSGIACRETTRTGQHRRPTLAEWPPSSIHSPSGLNRQPGPHETTPLPCPAAPGKESFSGGHPLTRSSSHPNQVLRSLQPMPSALAALENSQTHLCSRHEVYATHRSEGAVPVEFQRSELTVASTGIRGVII